jgi:hypothetical protein
MNWSKEKYLVEQLEDFTCRSKFVVQSGLVPLGSVIQSEVGKKKFEPVTRHRCSVYWIRISGPELLKYCIYEPKF